jgi:hypothetical protein
MRPVPQTLRMVSAPTASLEPYSIGSLGYIIGDVWAGVPQLAALCHPDVLGTQQDKGLSSLGGCPGVQPLSG